jgi:hypothetical protein
VRQLKIVGESFAGVATSVASVIEIEVFDGERAVYAEVGERPQTNTDVT